LTDKEGSRIRWCTRTKQNTSLYARENQKRDGRALKNRKNNLTLNNEETRKTPAIGTGGFSQKTGRSGSAKEEIVGGGSSGEVKEFRWWEESKKKTLNKLWTDGMAEERRMLKTSHF